MVEALPEWLQMGLGALVCLALPVLALWMIWGLVRTGSGIAKGLAGGPSEACVRLGLTLTKRHALSGLAQGLFETHPVRVSWIVGTGHGYDPSHHVTRVSAEVRPALGVGLDALEGGPSAAGIGWPELEQRVAVTATNAEGARAALAPAGQALWQALGGPGQVRIDDSAVTVELPGVAAGAAELEAALRRAVSVARALSRT